MNEFVEQFLIESRELIEQATDDLLTLEGRADDAERLDSAFRAFHTLKGAASIVDFDAMARALHAAEDVLSSVRAGDEPVTPELISDGLACLDQVARWLDAMQVDGEIPPGAEAAADAVVRRFQRDDVAAAPAPARSSGTGGWREALVARHPGVVATVALRYAPAAEAFLLGQDPLALLAAVPGLLVLEIEPPETWPELEDLDPFECRLAFLALAAGDVEATRAALGAVLDRAEIHALAPAAPIQASGLSPAAIGLIEAQLQLLEHTEAESFDGRAGSAATVAANILRHAGRAADSATLERSLAQARAERSAEPLARAIRGVLAGPPADAAGSADAEVVERPPAEGAARTLRVSVERIDAIVNLTGELLVAKNALGHAVAQAQSGADVAALLKQQHAVLQRLVEALQHSVLNIRVLQMRYVFQRFPRLVREMVVSLGKPAHLVTEGDETEADKVIVEGLFEPLLHVIRNALDHGVESPADRMAAGKPAAATIALRAHRRNDKVIVEVEDDGAGIDVARVRAVAARRRLASPEALAEMSDAEVVDLIFTPGFSTAANVTRHSGRGVGMDAVRTAIGQLGGQATVENRPGDGATVRFTLPFALLMSRILTVEAGGQLFGIPLEAVRETVRVRRGDVKPIGAARAFVLRDRTIPLIDLSAALGDRGAPSASDELNVVVAAAGGELGGLEVDRLGERLDVMLRPMDGLLAGVPGIAGTTLLGDGRVLLVLDLQELLG